jgi:pimeloyl-ACP methyl ester carboxylesterase
LDQLEDYVAAEGPFDGVLAFSQGAGLAAMHIVLKSLEGKSPPFKCAILFSSNEVYDPKAWLEHGMVQPMDNEVHGRPITIPTVVIYGAHDPYKDHSERLAKLCDPKRSFVVQHPGSHEIPGLGVKESIPEIVKSMRRAITQAALEY